jgi:hypothetical protein
MPSKHYIANMTRAMRALAALLGFISLFWAGSERSNDAVQFFVLGGLTAFLFSCAWLFDKLEADTEQAPS